MSGQVAPFLSEQWSEVEQTSERTNGPFLGKFLRFFAALIAIATRGWKDDALWDESAHIDACCLVSTSPLSYSRTSLQAERRGAEWSRVERSKAEQNGAQQSGAHWIKALRSERASE